MLEKKLAAIIMRKYFFIYARLGSHNDAAENSSPQGYYAMSTGKLLQIFRSHYALRNADNYLLLDTAELP